LTEFVGPSGKISTTKRSLQLKMEMDVPVLKEWEKHGEDLWQGSKELENLMDRFAILFI